MPNYIVKDNQIHFRQSFARPVLCKLFVTLQDLGVMVLDGDSRIYPNMVNLSESEFLYVIELSGE
jgi:hypothetical protein